MALKVSKAGSIRIIATWTDLIFSLRFYNTKMIEMYCELWELVFLVLEPMLTAHSISAASILISFMEVASIQTCLSYDRCLQNCQHNCQVYHPVSFE